MRKNKYWQMFTKRKRGRDKEVWEMKKVFFISAGFTSANNGRCEVGLNGLRHFRIFTDVDGL
jgi:hypothetical protein